MCPEVHGCLLGAAASASSGRVGRESYLIPFAETYRGISPCAAYKFLCLTNIWRREIAEVARRERGPCVPWTTSGNRDGCE